MKAMAGEGGMRWAESFLGGKGVGVIIESIGREGSREGIIESLGSIGSVLGLVSIRRAVRRI